MPTRKQRRRDAKSKRHEYEFVYVDDEGNVVEDAAEELEAPKRNGTKPTAAPAKKRQPAQRGRREPPQPSWNRALKRGALLGAVVFVLFSFSAKGSLVSVLPLALLYTALFVPFTYYIDRFAYRRWQARQQSGGAAPPPKKR